MIAGWQSKCSKGEKKVSELGDNVCGSIAFSALNSKQIEQWKLVS